MTALSVWRFGRLAITTGFCLSISFVFATAMLAPGLVIFLPGVFLALIVAWVLYKRPNLNLLVVLAAFPLTADFEAGIDIFEALYAVYYLSFLGLWYFKAIFVDNRKFVTTNGDRLVVAMIIWVIAYIPISFVAGGELLAIRSDLVAFSMLGFYFPIKLLVIDEKDGPKALFLVLLWIGIFVALRNLAELADFISRATQSWQVTRKGREATNEILLLVPALAMLVWALHLKQWRTKIYTYSAFLILLFGLLLTQSRGYWLSFLFGSGIVFLQLFRKQKVELVAMAVTGLAVSLVLVLVFFGDTAILLFAGLMNRVLSLATATTADISLVNRFLEMRAVFDRILENPIMGYGMGVNYTYFNITENTTRDWSFIHNGYLSLWYRFGIVGLVGVLVFWVRAIVVAIKSARVAPDLWHRILALVAAGGLSSMLVSALTSSPFYNNDLMLMFAVLAGAAAGVQALITRPSVALQRSP